MTFQKSVTSGFLATPQDSALIGEGNDEIQNTRVAYQERLAIEHEMDLVTQTRHGLHKQGAAVFDVCTLGAGLKPTERKGSAETLVAADAGYAIYHVADKAVYVWTGSTWYNLTQFVSLFTDVINELTAAAGVTVDGVLLKDSSIKASGGITTDGSVPAANTVKAGTITGTTITGTTVNGAVWQS